VAAGALDVGEFGRLDAVLSVIRQGQMLSEPLDPFE
jgi:hypothetical protein